MRQMKKMAIMVMSWAWMAAPASEKYTLPLQADSKQYAVQIQGEEQQGGGYLYTMRRHSIGGGEIAEKEVESYVHYTGGYLCDEALVLTNNDYVETPRQHSTHPSVLVWNFENGKCYEDALLLELESNRVVTYTHTRTRRERVNHHEYQERTRHVRWHNNDWRTHGHHIRLRLGDSIPNNCRIRWVYDLKKDVADLSDTPKKGGKTPPRHYEHQQHACMPLAKNTPPPYTSTYADIAALPLTDRWYCHKLLTRHHKGEDLPKNAPQQLHHLYMHAPETALSLSHDLGIDDLHRFLAMRHVEHTVRMLLSPGSHSAIRKQADQLREHCKHSNGLHNWHGREGLALPKHDPQDDSPWCVPLQPTSSACARYACRALHAMPTPAEILNDMRAKALEELKCTLRAVERGEIAPESIISPLRLIAWDLNQEEQAYWHKRITRALMKLQGITEQPGA